MFYINNLILSEVCNFCVLTQHYKILSEIPKRAGGRKQIHVGVMCIWAVQQEQKSQDGQSTDLYENNLSP